MALDCNAKPGEGAALLAEAVRQLQACFAVKLTVFVLALDYGSGVQDQVRRAMAAIPFGRTRTNGDLAKEIGVTAQAIGQACGANPLPTIIPRHSVVGASTLGGLSARSG